MGGGDTAGRSTAVSCCHQSYAAHMKAVGVGGVFLAKNMM